MLTACIVPAVLGCLLAVPASASADNSLDGRWLAKSATRNGQPAKDVVGHRLMFGQEKFEIRGKDGKVVFKGSFVVQRDGSPKRIDFRLSSGAPKGTVWKGVYERKGKRLKICDNAPDPKKPRPEKLAAPKDSGYILVVFDRIE